ncbi:MAG: di-trans,poly-cis-decaprenylcistransferase [SAR202 cluster bacterium Casp-Chloro-G4]|nr:polyprenyl diphosphate synthase [Chloroflexota bacterium]PKB60964.1 MAG: di-trans,poly-cis-decaprenylcistransferase [SAR202 cluster bacterium Casp-Chloro-G4]
MNTSQQTSDNAQLLAIPKHVAIIMDGNGRWATSQGRSRSDGHRAGTDNIRNVIKAFVQHGVDYVTLFAFSTENWDRPGEEVQTLISIIREVIRKESEDLHQEGVRIQHLGRLDRLSPGLQQAILDSVELTKNNTRLILNVAFDYGGRAEITSAVQAIIRDGVKAEDITEELLAGYLHTDGIPDPDLIIRTAGELRLSNFLIWQAAYAEYYSTPVYWPDFDETEVAKAIEAYGQRQRRFGKVL